MFIHTEKPLVTQQEAATKLAISQSTVAHLVKNGVLERATTVNGRSMLITAESVIRYSMQHHGKGRPLTPDCAMGLLFILSGEKPDWLTRRQQQRILTLLADDSTGALAWRTRKRARTMRLWCRNESLQHVKEQSLEGGVSNKEVGSRFDLPQAENTLECYMSETGVTQMMQQGWLREGEPQNVTIHVVSDVMYEHLEQAGGIPDAVCAVDLMESADPREHGTGGRQLEMMLQDWRKRK